MAGAVERYPEQIIPIGVVAMHHIEMAITEAERCLTPLGMPGSLIYTNAGGHLLHDPALLPFFACMAGQNLVPAASWSIKPIVPGGSGTTRFSR